MPYVLIKSLPTLFSIFINYKLIIYIIYSLICFHNNKLFVFIILKIAEGFRSPQKFCFDKYPVTDESTSTR